MGLTVHFEVLNQLGTPMMYSSSLATQPAAGIQGRIFFRTDSPYGIYRDNGTTWDQIAGSGGGGLTGSGVATRIAYFDSSTNLTSSANLYWDNTNNRLGVNTATPASALDIIGFQQTANTLTGITGATPSALPNSSISNTFTFNSGITTAASVNTIGLLVDNNLNYSGANTINVTSYNASGLIRNGLTFGSASASVTYTQATGIRALVNSQNQYIQNGPNSGTISHYANIQILGDQKTGAGLTTFTNRYGLLINDYNEFTAGNTYTNRWGIYQAGINESNFFAGKVGIGSGYVPSTFGLDVNGTARVSGAMSYTGGTGVAGSVSYGSTYGILVYGNTGSISDLTLTDRGGTLRFQIVNGGNILQTASVIGSVGIGTLSGVSRIYTDSTYGLVYIGNTSASTYSVSIFGDSGTNGLFLKNDGLVKIGAYNSTFNTSAILDIVSTTKGFLPPRMTTTEKNAISSPATGLQVYDTTLGSLNVYNGTSWIALGAGGGGGMAIGGAITSATAGSVLFAGTSGVLAQDNANFFWDNTNARLGIGTATPTNNLTINGSNSLPANSGSASNGVLRISNTINTTNVLDIGTSNLGSINLAWIQARNSNNYANNIGLVINPNGGNVGVNLQNPKTPLSLLASATGLPTLGTPSGNYSLVDISNAFGTYHGIVGATGDGWIQQMRIDGSATAYNLLLQPRGGNVGIGITVDAGFKLDVNGTARVSADALVNGVRIGRGVGNIDTNLAVGYLALNSNTTGYQNTAISYEALKANTTGINNTAIGLQSMLNNVGGNNNFGLGFASLGANTSGSANVAVGTEAMRQNTTASNNVSIGFQSLYAANSAYNVSIGDSSMRFTTSGERNVSIGAATLYTNTTGSYNTMVGFNAMAFSNTAGSNSGIGYEVLAGNESGSSNSAIGYRAGRYISGGSTANAITNNSIFIGFNTKALANNQTNQIVIGYETTGLGSNTTVIGNSSTTDAAIYGRLLVNYSAPVIGTYALDVNGTARITSSLFIFQLRTNAITITNSESPLVISGGTTQGAIITFANSGVQHNYTSGSVGIFTIGSPIAYAPTSGTGVFNTIALSPIINQTGGANGVTRGILIQPTLTAAADWRAIESSTGGAYFNTTSVAASAILQADSTTKGFLPPRMTTTQRDAITSPATGLVVYNTTLNSTDTYDGARWRTDSETIVTNRQTASYSLLLADRGKLIEMNVASANTLTIPLNSSIAFPIGTKIDVTQYGAGATTITATGGVTIRSFTSFVKLAGQYAAATLVKIGTDEWYAYGNLIA